MYSYGQLFIVVAALCTTSLSLLGCGGGGSPSPSPGGATTTQGEPTGSTFTVTTTRRTEWPPITTPPPPLPGLNFKVSKGLYSRGYDSVRLTFITEGDEQGVPSLDHSAQFAHRWTNKKLHTGLVKVGYQFQNAGKTVTIGMPKEGEFVTGLLVADPCWSANRQDGGFSCPNGDKMQILNHFSRIVNTLVGSSKFDYWGILGDNWYDNMGDITAQFDGQINAAAKTKPFFTVPGNHDFQTLGYPQGFGKGPGAKDQMGYAFAQYFGQDTFAATDSAPYDMSGNPDADQLAPGKNFLYGTHIGDLAFFGFSGAHGWDDTKPAAEGFCNYVGSKDTVNTVLVFGHWDEANLGCQAGMTAGAVHDHMSTLAGCSGKIMLYFEGHQHCNYVVKGKTGTSEAEGFMIGGIGQYGAGCSEFGFSVAQSLKGSDGKPNIRVDYFPIAKEMSWGQDPAQLVDNFEVVFACLEQRGYEGCRDEFATSWRSVPGQAKMQMVEANTTSMQSSLRQSRLEIV